MCVSVWEREEEGSCLVEMLLGLVEEIEGKRLWHWCPWTALEYCVVHGLDVMLRFLLRLSSSTSIALKRNRLAG